MKDEVWGRAKGGVARALALSPEERQESARRAAQARWKKAEGLREAISEGVLRIGDAELQCYVLDDEETRVLSRASFVRAIGRTGKVKGGRKFDGELQTPVFLTAENLKPFWPNDLEGNSKPVIFSHKGVEMIGYRAELLPDVCDIFQDAERAGVLRPNQKHIADATRILARGLTRVGIIGLVDEATGFQERRDKQALQKVLDAFLRKELAAWAKRFPDEFYEHIFRLKNWPWKGRKVNPPQVVAHYTKDIVYYRLAPNIVEELEKRNPVENGRRRNKHHQWLTDDVGHPALAQHLHAVITLMRVSQTWDQFKHMLDVAHPKRGDTLQLPFLAEEAAPKTSSEPLPLFPQLHEGPQV
jgi:P63C domain